jgi:hypothetical protein
MPLCGFGQPKTSRCALTRALRLSCRLSGGCGGGLGFCVIGFQLIQRDAIREFFDCIEPAKNPQHAEMDGFRAAPASGKDLAFEQGYLSGEAMWGVCHHVNATGGNGSASSETVCFTIHGHPSAVGVFACCVVRVSTKNSVLGLLPNSISKNLNRSMAMRHGAACFGWPSGQEVQ